MSRHLHWLGALAVLVLLAGCAGTATRKAPPAAVDVSVAAQAQAARVIWLDAHRDWSLEGRVAIRRADKGGSGRIDWTQRADTFEVSLSAPITRQSWRLTGDREGVVLDGLEGGPRRGADAGQLLLETTGWEIPVQALVYWIRGQVAPDQPQAQLQYGADGNLATLEQGGWHIAYSAWQPADGAVPAMPVRIEAERADARVRLIVDRWQTANQAVGAGRPLSLPVGFADEARPSAALAESDPAHPEVDLEARIARGSLRPVGGGGYRCQAPGFTDLLSGAGDMRLLPGTGDVVESAEHHRLLTQASEYATAYDIAWSRWLVGHSADRPDPASLR